MLNKVMIIGNLGADPELRYTQSGAAVATMSIATNERWTDRNGKTQERTEWHRVVVFGNTAENVAKYLAKGRSCYVEGRIQTRSWEDQGGEKRYTTEIVASTVTFLGGSGGGSPYQQDHSAGAGPTQPFDDSDIPF